MQQKIDADLFQNLLAHSSEAIVFSDLQGVVKFANPASETLYGWPPDELIGKNVDIFNSQETHSTDKIVEAIKNTGKWQGTLLQRRKDNSTFYSNLTVALVFDNENKPIGFGSHSRDISDEVRANQKLRDNEEKYRKLFENSQFGIAIHRNGKFLEYNQSLIEIFGYNVEAMHKLQVKDMIHPDDMAAVMQNIQERTAGSYRHKGIHKEGNTLFLEVHTSNIVYEGNNARVVMVHDITGLNEQADKIRSTLKEKNVLLGEIYHRTKNNMQVISGLLSLWASRTNDTAVLTAFQEIANKIQSMSLVHQKLYESRNLSSLRLDEYIVELAHLMLSSYESQEREVRLDFKLDPVTVLIDTAMACGLILSELLSNAFKHAFKNRANGLIHIELKRTTDDQIVFNFADDGIGFHGGIKVNSDQNLGLSTIIGIIEHQLNGSIDFESQEGLHCYIMFKDSQYTSRI